MAEQKAATSHEAGKQEALAHGTICWAELASTDLEAAKNFYTALLGWKLKPGDGGPMNYSEIIVGGRPVGGIYQITGDMGSMPSNWGTYVAVDDVDASAKQVEELGGKVFMGPMDIPNVGRFCMISDPTGGKISLITLSGTHS